MPVVEARQNIHIYQSVNGISSFTYSINKVSFIPDEVIIKTINYTQTVLSNQIVLLYTDLVSDNIGSVLASGQLNNSNLVFELKKPVSGSYTMQIFSYPNILNATLTGVLHICFEFIKYKEKGKLY